MDYVIVLDEESERAVAIERKGLGTPGGMTTINDKIADVFAICFSTGKSGVE